MKSYRKELHFHTSTRRAFMNITASVFINDNESGVAPLFDFSYSIP